VKTWLKRALLIAVAVVLVGVVPVCTWRLAVNRRHHEAQYSRAVEYIVAGEYTAGRELLETIKKYYIGETEALIHLCRAHEDLDAGNYYFAKLTIGMVHFKNISDSDAEAFARFKEHVIAEYDAENERERLRVLEEYLEQVKNGVPFVGMYETEIADTTLGAPSPKVRHNSEVENGQQYTANLYDFFEGDRKVFTARCLHGSVVKVWDKRNDFSTPLPSRPNKPSDPDKNDDPYNASDYTNEEDFYDEHYDDFFDFDDAEDYWRTHR
jgi:hypothetical protein